MLNHWWISAFAGGMLTVETEMMMEDPMGRLSDEIYRQTLSEAGLKPAMVEGSTDPQLVKIRTHARNYAAGRVTEIQARNGYMRDLRGSR